MTLAALPAFVLKALLLARPRVAAGPAREANSLSFVASAATSM